MQVRFDQAQDMEAIEGQQCSALFIALHIGGETEGAIWNT